MKTHTHNTIAWREGVTTDEVGDGKHYTNKRRSLVMRRQAAGVRWSVIGAFYETYATGWSPNKKQARIDAKPYLKPA